MTAFPKSKMTKMTMTTLTKSKIRVPVCMKL